MDEFVTNFWAENITCYDDFDFSEKQIMITKNNNFKIKCVYNNPQIITESPHFAINIIFNDNIKFEYKIDIIKFIYKQYDVDITDNLNLKNVTPELALNIIKTIGNIELLHEQLQSILPGYTPVICASAIIYNYKNKYRDNYNFIINVLLSECFTSLSPSGIHLELLNKLPEYLKPLTLNTYNKIRIGLTNINKFNTDYMANSLVLLTPQNYELELYKTSLIGYEVIKYALLNFNEYMLKKVNNLDIGLQNDTITVYSVEHNNPAVNAKFEELNDKNGYYGYHGSNIINWYNIILNNLLVAENRFIVNGDAFGKGIYISNDCGFSMGYSIAKNNSESKIIGVYQSDKPMSNYMKTAQIFVIPSSDNICLKYLIYIKGDKYVPEEFTILNNYFINGKHTIVEQQKTNVIKTVWSKRVMGEIAELYKRDCVMCDDGVKLSIDNTANPDQMNIITLNIFRETFTGTELFNDMVSMDISFIKLEIRLPSNYPFEPPFIRVVKPKFAYRKGHITMGGSVCMDLLTKQFWTPSVVILTAIIQIVHNIISGGGRLDPNGKNYEYSLYEAQQSFTHMLKTHALEWNSV